VVVVWHDQSITSSKCFDTAPSFPNDPDYPYVGKLIVNLTYSQIRTLDCGSKRQDAYPYQLLYPKTSISSMQEVFEFVNCADPTHQVLFNIESKIDPEYPPHSVGVEEFVTRQHAVFTSSGYMQSITYQSFDWRTLITMRAKDPRVTLSALIDELTIYGRGNATSAWLGGLRPDQFPGKSLGSQIAMAAHSIGARILSPQDVNINGSFFVTREMVDRAHLLGMHVKPWTVNSLNIADEIIKLKVDGIISDYPDVLRRWAQQQNLLVAPKYPKKRVLACLQQYLDLQ